MQKNYNNVTKEWLEEATPNSHEVMDELFYEHEGVKYIVDGKNVVLDYTKKEREVAEWLKNTFGGKIKMIPRVNNPEGIKTPDYIFRNLKFDLKEINGLRKRCIDDSIKSKKAQANNFIIDINNDNIDINEVFEQIEKIYLSLQRQWVNIIILKYKSELLKVYLRKNKKRNLPKPKARQDRFLYN